MPVTTNPTESRIDSGQTGIHMFAASESNLRRTEPITGIFRRCKQSDVELQSALALHDESLEAALCGLLQKLDDLPEDFGQRGVVFWDEDINTVVVQIDNSVRSRRLIYEVRLHDQKIQYRSCQVPLSGPVERSGWMLMPFSVGPKLLWLRS